MRSTIAFWLFLGLGAAMPAYADDGPQPAARAATFVVQSMLDGRKAEIGSGVVVARSGDVLTLATVAHLVNGHLPLRILDVSRRAYYDVLDVQVVAGYDLALIRVRAQNDFPVQPAPFGSASPGEPVWVWGNPGNGFWELSPGRIRTTDTVLPGADVGFITIDCGGCSFGDSGSGVFTTDGKLVGILSSGWRDRQGNTAFIQVEPLAPIAQALIAQSGGESVSARR